MSITKWCDSPRYLGVELSNDKTLSVDKYNELVNSILHITSSYELSIKDLEIIFNLILKDISEKIIPGGE